VLGLRISARSQVTLCAQGGGVEEAVTEDQVGSPERLCRKERSVYFIVIEAFVVEY
jgi:hypothetical protein